MKKPVQTTARTKTQNLPRDLAAEQLLFVSGGQAHDCVTASGDTCEGDDCGPIRVGSHCG
ncbi:MAG: hypothetical protein JO257_29875 [Deltaproteobacteria bacterium]|nr:hypothetical protein [Deltaproteobacteria bacterium]